MLHQVRAQTLPDSSTVLTLSNAIELSGKTNKDIRKQLVQYEIEKQQAAAKRETIIPDVYFHTGYGVISPLDQFEKGITNQPVRYNIPRDLYDFSVSTSVPLFMGGRVHNEIKKQQYHLELTAEELAKLHLENKLEITTLYLNAWYYTLQEEVVKQSIYEDSLRIKQVKSLKKNGAVTLNEVMRAGLQLSNHQLTLLTITNSKDIALHTIATALELEGRIILLDTTNVLAGNMANYDFEECLQQALTGRQEVKMAATSQSIAKADVRIAKSRYYPVISAYGNYGFYHPNFKFFPPTNYAYRLGSAGVELSFNISALYKNRRAVNMARLKTEWQQYQTDKVNEEISNEVFAAQRRYTEAVRALRITTEAEATARENYRLVRDKYFNQLAIITDLVDADNALFDARTKLVTARIQALLSYYRLQYTMGTI